MKKAPRGPQTALSPSKDRVLPSARDKVAALAPVALPFDDHDDFDVFPLDPDEETHFAQQWIDQEEVQLRGLEDDDINPEGGVLGGGDGGVGGSEDDDGPLFETVLIRGVGNRDDGLWAQMKKSASYVAELDARQAVAVEELRNMQVGDY